MKVFSTKSRKQSLIALLATCLASFCCALILLFSNTGLFAVAQGNTLSLTVDFVSGQTLAELDLGAGYEGYAFEDGTALVPVGTNTYTLTKAGAENVTLTLTVNAPLTNVEDIIDANTYDDYLFKACDNSSVSSNAARYAVYSKGYAEAKYGSDYYWSINTTTRTPASTYVNENNYDGNISLYSNYKGDAAVSIKKTSQYGVIRFRTTFFTTDRYSFNMMRAETQTWYTSTASGYGINFQKGNNETGDYFVTQFYKSEKVGEGNISSKIKDWGSNWYVADSADAYVTFGVYPVIKDGAIANAIILKVEEILSDGTLKTAVNEIAYDTNVSTLIVDGSCFSFSKQATSQGIGQTLLLEGVNRPLFAEEDFAVEDTYDEGTALKDIPLPTGVNAWKNPEQIITRGANTFTGVVNSEYYGATSYEVNVTVTGGEKPFATSLDVKYVSGLKVSDLAEKLPQGCTFADKDLEKELAIGAYEFTGIYDDSNSGERIATITVNVLTPAITNIEEVIDESDDVKLLINNSEKTAWATDGIEEASNYNIYTNAATEEQTNNANQHNGNLSIHYTGWKTHTFEGAASASAVGSAGIVLNNSTKYGLYRVRMTLRNNDIAVFGMMRSKDITTLRHNNFTEEVGGYVGYIQHNGSAFVPRLNKINEAGEIETVQGDGTPFAFADGSQIIIEFGVYPIVHTDGRIMNTIIFRGFINNEEIFSRSKTDLSDTGLLLSDSDENLRFTIGQTKRTNANKLPFTIEGINEPLFGVSGNFDTVVEDTYPENQALSSITAPEGYEWTENASTTMLNYDQKQYDAYYQYDYYGTTHKLPAKVTLSLTPVNRTLLTLKYGETEFASYALACGEEQAISLTAQQIATLGGQFIGWIADNEPNKLYKPEDTYVATTQGETTEIVLNAVVLDFKLIEGAAFKVKEGGLRFFVAFDTKDWATVKPFVDCAKGVIVPYDSKTYYDDGFTEYSITKWAGDDFKDKTAYLASQIGIGNDYEGYSIYTFSIDQIMYQNYNRVFAGMAFINVKYHDQDVVRFETAFDLEDNTRSIYQVASMSGNPLGHKYIANTVELALDNGVIRYENFFTNDVERTYETEHVSYQIDGSKITVLLTVESDSLLADADTNEGYCCVYFKDMADTGAQPVRYKATIVSCIDNVATIEFDIA